MWSRARFSASSVSRASSASMMARCSGRRRGGAVGTTDGELAITAHVQENVVGHVDQGRRFRQRDQRLVEGDIGLRIFLDMILRQAVPQIEILEEVAQRRDVALAGGGGDQPCRHALQRRPGADHVDDLGLGPADHDDAAARHGFHKAVLLEHRDRFADRRAADAEPFRQRALVQHHWFLRRVDVHLENGFLQGLIGLVLEARLRRNPNDRYVCISHGWQRLGCFALWHDSSPPCGRPLLPEETLGGFWHTKYQYVKFALFSEICRGMLA